MNNYMIEDNRIVKTRKSHTKNVYIVLTQTQTYPARAIRFYTHEPYAHASIAFDEDLEEMYSFARKGIYNPFNAGFIREHLDRGIFGRFSSTSCGIYRLQVTDEQCLRLKKLIEKFNLNKEVYSYNYLGLIGAAFNIPIQSKNKYFCSQFVAYVLEESGIHIFDKSYALVKPRDIRINPRLKSVYQGKLSEYRMNRKNLRMA